MWNAATFALRIAMRSTILRITLENQFHNVMHWWYLVPPYYYFAVFMAKMQWTFIPAFSILAVSRGPEILHDGKWWKPIKCALYDRKKWTPSYSIQCSALYLIKFSNLVSESLRSSLPLIYLMKNQYANVVSCLLYNVQLSAASIL